MAEDPARVVALKGGEGRGVRIAAVASASVLSPGTGFMSAYRFTLNPYSGCAFACDYCYARGFAPSEEKRDQWGRWVRAKMNVEALIERAIRSKSEKLRLRTGDTIYLSSVTDPYQPIEKRLMLTQKVLQLLIAVQPRLTIQTRSPLVTRDIGVLRQFEHIRVNVTITTDDEAVRRAYEPACPPIEARFGALEALKAAGIPIGVSVSPMLPLRDAQAFGRRLAGLEAAEYVTQFFHQGNARFRASTRNDTLVRVHNESNWNGEKYAEAAAVIREAIAPRPLLEGADGFAPPP